MKEAGDKVKDMFHATNVLGEKHVKEVGEKMRNNAKKAEDDAAAAKKAEEDAAAAKKA